MEIPEIMVRHKTRDEALPEVDRFLDRSFRDGSPRVRVIHGKGGGILRRAIHEMLKDHPLVRQYDLADAAGGSWGATNVDLHSIGPDFS